MARLARRRSLVLLGACIAAPRSVWGQAKKVRIGVLGPRSNSVLLPPVLKRLAELGYAEGKNVVIDYRSADGIVERFPSLARELIKADCDLIVAVGAVEAARALADTKARVPVLILANDYDPVQAGIVPNLRRPGGNITGVVITQLTSKRLEIMREIMPRMKRVLVLGDGFTKAQSVEVQQSAKRLGVAVVSETFTARPYAIDAAFDKGRTLGVEAALVLVSPALFDLRTELAEAVTRHRIPATTGASAWGDRGFLFAYGADYVKAFSRGGDIAASILRGANPGEIPVEQSTEFEFMINLAVARDLSLKVPQAVLARATRVIE